MIGPEQLDVITLAGQIVQYRSYIAIHMAPENEFIGEIKGG